jgi:uncharacterized protein (DUF58 family)
MHGAAGRPPSRAPAVEVARHASPGRRRGLRIGAVALAAVLFVFLPQPTGAAILLIAVGLLVVLAGIEFLARVRPRSSLRRRPTHRPEGGHASG